MGIKFTVSSHNLEDFACKGTTFFSLLQGCLIFREDYSIRIEKYTGIADNCGIEGEKSSPQMTSNKEKSGEGKAAITNGWRQCSYCNGVVATVAGRRENCQS